MLLRRKLFGFGTPPAGAEPARHSGSSASGGMRGCLAEPLKIHCPSPTAEDRVRDKHRLRGQFLARQDRWEELTKEVRDADVTLSLTPAGMPVAELLCFGARADVVAAVEHALIDGRPARNAPMIAGIEALEEMLSENPSCSVRAVIVAQAHMDLGWAWRGSDWHAQVPSRNLQAFEAHFDRARDILVPFVTNHNASTLCHGALCTLNGRGIDPNARLAQQYEQLIDMNPMAPAPMRALGTYLSPRWYGSHDELELEARRTAARTHKQWGAGAYTWVQFDTLAGDPVACENLDLEFFIEGLHDILDRLPDQHTANTMAAYCAQTIGFGQSGHAKADAVRGEIAACANWIVRHHLTELHPLIWAHAAAAFDNNLKVSSARNFAATGRQNALRSIASLFRHEIADGNCIIFTDDGPVAEHH